MMDVIATIFVVAGVISFWVSTGLTEGWNWRIKMGKADTHPAIKDGSYHLWRLLTNASLPLVILGSALYSGSPADLVSHAVVPFLIGWLWYERLISWVQFDDSTYHRPPFRLLGKEYPRPKLDTVAFIIYVICALVLML